MSPDKVLKFALGPLGLGALGFISVPLLSWFFTPSDIGVLATLQLVVGFVLMVTSLGLDQSYAREYHAVRDRRLLFFRCFLPGLCFLCAGAAALLLIDLSSVAEFLFGFKDPILVWMVILGCVFGYLARYVSLYYRLAEHAFLFSISQLLPKVIFILIALFAVFLGAGFEYLGLTGSYVGGLVSVAIFFLLVRPPRQKVIKRESGKEPGENFLDLVQYAIPLLFSGLGAWALKSIDRVALRSLSTLDELGIYSVAVTIAGGAALFASIFNIVWAPYVYKMAAIDIDKGKIALAGNIVEFFVFILLCLVGIASPFMPFFLPEQYALVGALIPLCVFVPLVYSLSEAVTIGINLSKKTACAMYATLIAFVACASLNYLLVGRFGAIGAAVGTATAFVVYFIVRFEFARKVWDVLPRKRVYFVVLIALCIAVAQVGLVERENYVRSSIWLACLFLGVLLYRAEMSFIRGYFLSLPRLRFKGEK